MNRYLLPVLAIAALTACHPGLTRKPKTTPQTLQEQRFGDIFVPPGTVTVSGTITAVTTITNPVTTVGAAATGAAVSGNPVRIGLSDGTNTRDAKSDSSGNAVVVGAGVAGTPAGGVVSMQGVASGTAVPVSGTLTAVTTVGTVTNPVPVGNVATIGTSITPGTSAAHLGKAEDAAHTSGDTGVAVWCRRIDTAATSADTSGDYATFDCDATGRLRTRSNPDAVASTSYWSSQSSAATLTGSSFDATNYRTACVSFTLANTSTPVGTLEIDSSPDGTNNWEPIYLDANKPSYVIGTTWTTFSGGQTISISSPSGTVTINACVEANLPFLRLVYTRTSGGASSTINASYTLRAN